MSPGTKLRQLRNQRGMTQDEASRASGISGANISRLEDDQSPHVAAMTLSALARTYRVDVRELYRAAGWYSTPPEILEEEAKQLTPEEQSLIDTIRSAPTPQFRESLLKSLTDLATIASRADADRIPRVTLARVAEEESGYEEDQ